jgi:hypothetical protein
MKPMYDTNDDGSHFPPLDADPSWQESIFLSWYDVRARAGGYHHVDFQPHRQRCCVWSWTAVDGVVTNRYQSLSLPLAPDVANFTAGALTVRSVRPLESIDLQVRSPRSDVVIEHVMYTAFTPLLYQRMNPDGSAVTDHGSVGLSDYGSANTGHYETFGRFDGVVGPDDARRRVAGVGMQDHSWGPRQYGKLTSAHRFLHMTLGTDLFASLYAMTRDVTDFDYGYVYDDGLFHSVDSIHIETAIGRDGHTPTGCEGTIWTRTGRGYEFSATMDVASVSTHDGGYFATDAYGRFRLGARVGGGLLSVRERGEPSSQHRAWLDEHDNGSASS